MAPYKTYFHLNQFVAEFEIALNQVFNSNDSYWIDLQDVFERNFENLQKLRASAMKLVRTPIPANHMMVKRIVVTPINKICLPATPVACSRLLRRFGHEFEFIIVSFREEEFQKLEGTFALHRVKSHIQHGIKAIKHYWFFCASASQLRDHKAYFVAANTFDQVDFRISCQNFCVIFINLLIIKPNIYENTSLASM